MRGGPLGKTLLERIDDEAADGQRTDRPRSAGRRRRTGGGPNPRSGSPCKRAPTSPRQDQDSSREPKRTRGIGQNMEHGGSIAPSFGIQQPSRSTGLPASRQNGGTTVRCTSMRTACTTRPRTPAIVLDQLLHRGRIEQAATVNRRFRQQSPIRPSCRPGSSAAAACRNLFWAGR